MTISGIISIYIHCEVNNIQQKMTSVLLLLSLFSTIISVVQSVYCVKDYSILVPFNIININDSLPPLSADILYSECRVNLDLDYNTLQANITFRSNKTGPLLEEYSSTTRFIFMTMEPKSIKSFYSYTCTTSDYCDLDFIQNTLRTISVTLYETIYNEIFPLLYDPDPANMIFCDMNSTCPQSCSITGGCSLGLPYLLLQNYLNSSFFVSNRLFYLCNKDDCLSQTIVDNVQRIIQLLIFQLNIQQTTNDESMAITTQPFSAENTQGYSVSSNSGTAALAFSITDSFSTVSPSSASVDTNDTTLTNERSSLLFSTTASGEQFTENNVNSTATIFLIPNTTENFVTSEHSLIARTSTVHSLTSFFNTQPEIITAIPTESTRSRPEPPSETSSKQMLTTLTSEKKTTTKTTITKPTKHSRTTKTRASTTASRTSKSPVRTTTKYRNSAIMLNNSVLSLRQYQIVIILLVIKITLNISTE
ncbi:unnamed protein product [Didymodactylos carnosus]|uniref:Uncharacterized protein n=1 Tax=Didymodactylos carnosus TaxID=1234261 RepID=A0A814T128_9BILA|nr:unnamed protein product [Didymodactylos carnosus]CAF1155622.1 unnamed protein product [Didymodactylos carnosus]CAF3644286.1 unnamed protein product [Didymodactylos carnosus]CAF3919086.1 unnamed protein product [Didymodactylos carnosus]